MRPFGFRKPVRPVRTSTGCPTARPCKPCGELHGVHDFAVPDLPAGGLRRPAAARGALRHALEESPPPGRYPRLLRGRYRVRLAPPAPRARAGLGTAPLLG